MIEIQGLTRTFGDLTAIDGLTLSIEPGEIFGLVGPDGAGKTTTLRILSTLMAPTRGTVRVAGFDVVTQSDRVKDSIGYMAQRFGLYADLTIDENLDFYSDLFGVSRAERAALLPDLLRMTRMEPFRARQAGQLSGGMKQKLALMCTLIHHPKVLFLDEPTNGVDPVSRRDFWAILYELVKSGITVLVTTAYLDEAERCNRVALMDRGRLIRCDTPYALRHRQEERCFELTCRDPRAVRAYLETRPDVLSVEPSGATLHLFTPGAPEPLARALVEQRLGPADFREIVPSLEDVFIALVRKQARRS